MNPEEHKAYHRRLAYVIVLILILLFGGAFFYINVEKWRFIDALYFAAATMTTVGYGDISPRTDVGKLFTIVYLFVSVGIVLYGLSLLGAHFVEEREEHWFRELVDPKTTTKEMKRNFKKFFSSDKEKLIDGHEESFGKK
jgi:hypothetical protein